MTKTPTKGFDTDSVLTALKWNGRYQVFQISLVMLHNIPVAMCIFSIVFIGYHNPSQCNEVNSTSVFLDNGVNTNMSSTNIRYGECDITISSNLTEDQHLPCVAGYQYTKPKDSSLNSEWDLVCGKGSLSDLLQTFFSIGSGLGAVVFTYLADKRGRKPVNCVAGIGFLVFGIGVAYAPNYPAMAVLRVLHGSVMMGMSLICTIMFIEIVPTSKRSLLGCTGTLVWGVSVMMYSGLAYLMRDLSWRLHQLIISLFGAYYLLMPWAMDESIRWLSVMNKHERVKFYLRKAARVNGKEQDKILTMLQTMNLADVNINELEDKDEINLKDTRSEAATLFTDRRILGVCVIVWLVWITDSMSYYALSLTSTEFHPNKYVGFCLSAFMEVLSAPAYLLTVDRFGRRQSCFGFHLMAGLSLILFAICQHFSASMPSLSIGVTVLSLIGKFSISTAYCVVWFYTPEIFPTTTRNFTVGLASTFSRIGGLIAPFSRTLHRHHPWLIGAVIGSFCLLVCFLTRYLPETANQELPQTIADMRRLLDGKDSSKTKSKKLIDKEENDKQVALLSTNDDIRSDV